MRRQAKTNQDMTVKEFASLLKISESQAKSILIFVQQMGGIERASTAVQLFETVTKKAA